MIRVPADTHRNMFRFPGYAYYDVLRPIGTDAHKKQTWIVKKDSSDGTFLFESVYWTGGNYLIGNNGDWLYVDDNSRENWWNVTSSNI